MRRAKTDLLAQLRTIAGCVALTIVASTATAEPPLAQAVAVPAPPGVLAEVPFTTSHNWVILDVKIGKDFTASALAPTLHFLLDTGASGSVLTKEAIDANKLDLDSALNNQTKVHADGAGDSAGITSNQSVRAAVRIGDLQFVDPLAVFSFGESMRKLGIDGLIGGDILRSFVTEVDYSAHKVRFYDAAKFRPPTDDSRFEALPLHFRDSDNLPFIDAGITPFGFSPTLAHMTLDTGDDRCVTLYTPFVERQRWQDALPRTVPANFSGVGGNGTAVAGRLRAVSLGATKLDLPTVVFATSKKGALASEETDGQFGGMLLDRFTIILDYGHRMLYLRPNELAATRFPPLHYVGYFATSPMTMDGGYRIDVVEAGSPAEKAGLHVGDILYKVGDTALAGLDAETLTKTLQQSSEFSTIEIGAGSGAPRRQVVIAGVAY